MLPAMPQPVVEVWQKIGQLPGSGCNKTKLKQAVQDAFFSNDMNFDNSLFCMVAKLDWSEANNNDAHCVI